MAYAATAGEFPASVMAAPGVLALQRALVWLVGASGAMVGYSAPGGIQRKKTMLLKEDALRRN